MKNKIFRLFILFSLSLQAQVTVESGLNQMIVAKAGETAIVPINLSNQSNALQRVKFDLVDYTNDCEEGYIYFNENEVLDFSLRPWIQLENEELYLLPNEKRSFLVKVAVPEESALSTAHTSLFVRNAPVLDSSAVTGVVKFAVQIQYAVNLIYSNPDYAENVHLEATELQKDTSDLGSLSITIKNTSKQSTNYSADLEILSAEGITLFKGSKSMAPIQGEQCRTLNFEKLALPHGSHGLFLILQTEAGQIFSISDQIIWP